ncbi:MAG: TonB-dependent receptor [Pseudomonadota bacterium]
MIDETMPRSRRRSVTSAWLAGAVLLSPVTTTPTFAQDTAADAIETITVTATRRENVSVQDVPASINVLSAETLENANVTALSDLEQLAPSVQITQTESSAAGTLISIRGIGTLSNNPGFEPSVGVLIDGVFRTRTGIALSELPELSSLEVLRGPQGTLFGRNTSSGAVSINTVAPSKNTEGYVSAYTGNYGALELEGALNLPLSDQWSTRLDAVVRNRDGYIHEVNTGSDINDIDRVMVRGQLQYDSDVSTLRIIGDVGSSDEACCASLVIDPGPLAPIVSAIAVPQGVTPFASSDIWDYEVALSPNRQNREQVDEWGVSAQYDRSVGDVNLTSISAYRNWEVLRDQDVDGSGLDRSFRGDFDIQDQSFTQELRLQGDTGRLNWLVGGFYLNQQLELTDTIRGGADSSSFVDVIYNQATRSAQAPTGFQVYGTLPGVPSFLAIANPAQAGFFIPPVQDGEGQQADNFKVDTQAFALFTHNEWSLNERLVLTTGARFTYERKELDFDLNATSSGCDFLNATPTALPLLGAVAPLVCSPALNTEANGTERATRDDSQLSGTVKLAYALNDGLLSYASYSRGFKSGGFNLARSSFNYSIINGIEPSPDDLEFDAETADAYELGVNSTFGDGAVLLNGAVYFQNIEGFQNLVFNGNNFVVFNAPAESYGAELDLIARPSDGLTIQSGISYNNVELTEDIVAGTTLVQGGEQLARSPELTVTAAATYAWPLLNSIDGLVHINSRFVTEQSLAATGAASNVTQGDFIMVGARIAILSASDTWSLSLFGENLLDEEFLLQTFQLPELQSTAAYAGVPRTYGIEFRYNF